MMVDWFVNGHHVEAEYFEEEDYYGPLYFFGTTKPFDRDNIPPCPKCKLCPIKDKEDSVFYIDGCLGKLPGVNFACCGHGV